VVGDGTTATSLTASNRCKGLTILCDTLTVKNNSSVNMTGKGARVMVNDDSFYPFVDFNIPIQISLSSGQVSFAQALAVIKAQGFATWDFGTWQSLVAGMYGFNLGITVAGSVALMQTAGCGAGVQTLGGGLYGHWSASAGTAGKNGGTGAGATGGAYNVNGYYAIPGKPGSGSPYAGGSGSGASCAYNGLQGNHAMGKSGPRYSGPGGAGGCQWYQLNSYADESGSYNGAGGAGNPGGPAGTSDGIHTVGNGCGGKLVIICTGALTLESGGKIEANGMVGGSAGYGGGGGSGGGHLSVITQSASQYQNNGTVQAAGGAGGNTSPNNGWGAGGAGGAGSVVIQTFTQMGW